MSAVLLPLRLFFSPFLCVFDKSVSLKASFNLKENHWCSSSRVLKVKYPLLTKNDTDPFAVSDGVRGITNCSAIQQTVADKVAKIAQVAALFYWDSAIVSLTYMISLLFGLLGYRLHCIGLNRHCKVAEIRALLLCALERMSDISAGRKCWSILSVDPENTGLNQLFSIMMDYIGYQYQMHCSFGTDGGKSGSLIYGHKSSMFMTSDGLNKEPAALDEHIQPFL